MQFGIMSDSVEKQLTDQNIKFKNEEIDRIQKMLESVYCLKFSSILSDKLSDKCYEKIMRKLIAHVKTQL